MPDVRSIARDLVVALKDELSKKVYAIKSNPKAFYYPTIDAYGIVIDIIDADYVEDKRLFESEASYVVATKTEIPVDIELFYVPDLDVYIVMATWGAEQMDSVIRAGLRL